MTSQQRNNKNCIKADQEPAAVCGQRVYVKRNVTGNPNLDSTVPFQTTAGQRDAFKIFTAT